MRDTSDMMEDAPSEDTMMDCGGEDGGLEDVDLATDIMDSSSTIQDAAERLLTLLGMDDDNQDLLSSSEDEGVEVDELEDDNGETENTRLLHKLAVSLAQELKYSQKQSSSSSRESHHDRDTFETTDRSVHSMSMLQDTNYLGHNSLQDQMNPKAPIPFHQNYFVHDNVESKDAENLDFCGCMNLDRCLRMCDLEIIQTNKTIDQPEQDPGSWISGWNACASEALRYLIENEGLSLQHPTVVALKNHLDLQRERVFAQYTAYMEAKSQDMSVILD